ncbi:hypothetical protein GCM10009634_80400 [Saccharothrix xinjiangensis]
MAEGLGDTVIAEEFVITEGGVHKRPCGIFVKFGLAPDDRAEVARRPRPRVTSGRAAVRLRGGGSDDHDAAPARVAGLAVDVCRRGLGERVRLVDRDVELSP